MLCPRQIRARNTLYTLRDGILKWPIYAGLVLHLHLDGGFVPSSIERVCVGTNVRYPANYAVPCCTRFCLPSSVNKATQVSTMFVYVRR